LPLPGFDSLTVLP